MKSFFTKFMDRLKDGFSTDNEDTTDETSTEIQSSKSSDAKAEPETQKAEVKQEIHMVKQEKKQTEKKTKNDISNIVELNEQSIQAIINSLSAIKYSNVRLSEIRLHLRYDKQDPTSIAAESLYNSEKFLDNLKYKLTDAGIKYMDDIKVKLIYSSSEQERYIQISSDLSLQALTFEDTKKMQKLIVTALSGILWEDEVELVPRAKPYYIGRCKMPELDKSIKIKNDIAFVGPEEKDEPQYEINRLVSRSIASIIYNDKTGNFELMRSSLMNNRQHIIKIVRVAGSVQQISVNNTEVSYPLQDDDQIVFNDKIALLINTAEI